ncbi:MAG TPA: nicotinamide-nucleotide adenylyltransferase [Candidatus Thermoplasmatota archaeon]|nr:nicotinamide-nucleotide adenylyltransferase [Candidatus Thermoplasmatota archaeon]
MARALVVGRFQPFHNGHLALVAYAIERHGGVVVAIGSAEQSHTLANPFTAGERHEMIRESLREAGLLDRATVVAVPDVNRNPLWVSHVRAWCPPFDVVITNNALPRRLFTEAGVRVEGYDLVERATLEGTRIRELILAGGAWRACVPPAVSRVLDRIGAEERMRTLAGSDAGAGGPKRA